MPELDNLSAYLETRATELRTEGAASRQSEVDALVADCSAQEAEIAALTVEVDEARAYANQQFDLATYWQTTYETHMAEAHSDPAPAPEPEPEPEPQPAGAHPTIFGGATTNDPAKFNQLNALWGPIRASCEYDSAKGILPIDQYAWFNFVKNQGFKYLRFSCDESNGDYPAIAAGVFDSKIRAMVNSLSLLPGVRGVVCLGNEPNADKGIPPSDYRAAIEHVMDTFALPTGWTWGVAFSNWNVWGGGSTAGENWLPRRPDKEFVVETHFYGRTDYPDPAAALGRTLLPAVRSRPLWRWQIGELSAQESSTNPKAKGDWFTAVGNYCIDNGAQMFLPFDTGVGGSAAIGTTTYAANAMKAIAQKCAGNNWS